MKRPDYEAFLRLVEELKGYTLIVEGKKDKRALKALGLYNIIPLNGQPIADFVDGIDEKSHIVILSESADKCLPTQSYDNSSNAVVILTDFDKEGKRLCAKLLKLLQRRRIKANPRLRHMLMAETGITRIEELDTALGVALTKKEKGDSYGEIGANFYEIHNKSKRKGERHNREA